MSDKTLSVVFMGSPDFAAPALEALHRAGHRIVCVVTQPDRVRGRGGKVLPTPVSVYAQENGLPLLKPERIKDNEDFLRALQKAGPDLIVVAAYGKILPKSLLGLPALGCVNIHASLLPEYRGAAPVQRAILDGKRETGVTLMYMAEELDKGDMIATARTDVSELNAGGLTDRLARLGAGLLTDMIPALVNGTAPRIPQDESKATYAEKISKAEGQIDLRKSAGEAVLKVRAMTPAPGAFVMNGGERIVVTEARGIDPEDWPAFDVSGGDLREMYDKSEPGTVLAVSKEGIGIRTGSGVFLIEALKAPGRKAMPVREYIKGNSFETERPLA
ncbi:MAG: methionyl-tRNA formyltransferase [Clostridiales bacterium]|nr:methionyl-tRNA formyltransferase [Clostridiales bacterium]